MEFDERGCDLGRQTTQMEGLSSYRFRWLPVDRIDAGDATFRQGPEWLELGDVLRKSVRLCGIRNPLRLQERGDGTYRIVEGFRRMSLAIEAEWDEIPAVVVGGEDAELYLAAAAENAACRGLTELEKAKIVQTLLKNFSFSEERLLRDVLPLLGVRASLHLVRRLLSLAELPETLLRATAGILEVDTALELAEWSEPEQEFFLGLLDEHRLGSNKQKQLFELLDELRRRDHQTANQVWINCGARAFEAEELPPAHRFAAMRKALRNHRFPTMVRYEEEFDRLLRAMELPRHVTWNPPPQFEGESYDVLIRVGCPEDLRSAAEALAAASRKRACQEIFELL